MFMHADGVTYTDPYRHPCRSARTASSGFIYLRKSQPELQLRELQLEATGTAEQLRERLVSYVREHPEGFRADVSSSVMAQEAAPGFFRPHPSSDKTPLERVRKWNLKFQGADPIFFLVTVTGAQGSLSSVTRGDVSSFTRDFIGSSVIVVSKHEE